MGEAEPIYPFISVEEYLLQERASDHRHEFRDGVVEAMSGASKNHNVITLNLAAALHAHLKGTPCTVYHESLQLHIQADQSERYYYPDVMVDCEQSSNAYATQTPRILVEVLSPSTMHKDLFTKLAIYKQIQSVEEIIIISQERLSVQVYRRSNDWKLEPLTSIADVLALRSIDFTLTLPDLYDGVTCPDL